MSVVSSFRGSALRLLAVALAVLSLVVVDAAVGASPARAEGTARLEVTVKSGNGVAFAPDEFSVWVVLAGTDTTRGDPVWRNGYL